MKPSPTPARRLKSAGSATAPSTYRSAIDRRGPTWVLKLMIMFELKWYTDAQNSRLTGGSRSSRSKCFGSQLSISHGPRDNRVGAKKHRRAGNEVGISTDRARVE